MTITVEDARAYRIKAEREYYLKPDNFLGTSEWLPSGIQRTRIARESL